MTWLRVVALRFSGMFGKRGRDAQLEEELQSHLEMLVEQNLQRGMPADEARRAAKLALGGAEQIKEAVRDQRGLPFLESLIADTRFALRILRKNPGFTAVAVLTLALGIGACTVVFSVYYALMFNGFAAKDASRLAVPVIHDVDLTARFGMVYEDPMSCSPANFDAIRAAFEDIVCFRHANMLLADGNETYQLDGAYVSANAFDFYGIPPLLGRGIKPSDAKPGAPQVFVISYSVWKSEFNADPQVLGGSFTVDYEPRILVGIMPPRFQAYGAHVGLWMPVDIHVTSNLHTTGLLLTLGRLKPGTTLGEASANLDVIVRRLAKDQPHSFPAHFTVRVQSASDFLMGSHGIGNAFGTAFSVKHMIYSMLVGILMLLLIACVNVANLLLARATAREKEIAIRAALGATRSRLIRQLLAESSVLAAAACVVGCIFAYFGLRGATAIMPKTWDGFVGGEIVFGLNLPVLFFTLIITALTTLICGLVPALRAAKTDLQAQLAGSAKGVEGSFQHGRIRASLVVGEVALSIVLLTGAGLIIRSFFLLTHADLGFRPTNVLLLISQPRDILKIPIPGGQRQLLITRQNEKFLRVLKTMPGVEDVAIDNTIAGYGGGRGSAVGVPGGTEIPDAGVNGSDENLLSTLNMQMVSGRWLSKADLDSALHVTVINETMARKLWGDKSPIGQQLEVKLFQAKGQPPQDTYFLVAGVVHDLKNVGPAQPALPEAFIPYTIQRTGVSLLTRTRTNADSLIHPVEERIWAVDPDAAFVYAESLGDFLDELSYSLPRFGVMTIAPVAGIALLLVMTGIFSVMAYTVSLRTREIGIRMALGAQQGDVLRMVLRKGLGLVAAGVAIGLCTSLALTRLLASQISGVSSTDSWTFGAVIAVIVVVGLAACYIAARRAMKVDPMVALRYE